ncbi:MAG TPA: chorismate-binding protein [Bacteroidia bacterium]|jgi:anthranilate synthase component 1|nr:chorismate-binding protein [Bacteroidia bacterium]
MNTTTYITEQPKTEDRKPIEGNIPLVITIKTVLADTVTPVALYLRLRDIFPGAVLLESADNNNGKNSRSFIAVQSSAEIIGQDSKISISVPSCNIAVEKNADRDLSEILSEFTSLFKVNNAPKVAITGLIGYLGYDAIPFFEDVKFRKREEKDQIPFLRFALYKYIIVFDHLHHQLHIVEQLLPGETSDTSPIEKVLYRNSVPKFQFRAEQEQATVTDEEFLAMTKTAMQNCAAGNIFQVVLSRKFKRKFSGDEFNVYRALRAINPSPYLFYADFGNYKIFGSSPEAQLVISNPSSVLRPPFSREVIIHPIAGTFRRTGDEATDRKLEEQLLSDPKENSEHIMLVDLARNDLSRNASEVTVASFREVHRYSHVIHLVSTVKGKLNDDSNAFRVLADTFPAGTLSGAPKIKAMQIIDELEKDQRGYYGGCIGLAGFDGTLNVAIMIRSFLSNNNELQYRAGAGVTINSVPENELQEINNKLGALRKAVDEAEKM